MGLTLATAAEIHPVSLAEAKAHLRVDIDDDDDLIGQLIEAAVDAAQIFTRRQFIEAEFIWTADRFPSGSKAIELPRPPLISVESITYIDDDGEDVEMDVADYVVDETDLTGGRVTPAYEATWPLARNTPASVRVAFTAGYGDEASSVPAGIRAAIKLIIGHLYENREAVIVGTIATEVPMAAQSLLMAHRAYEFA